MKYYIFNTRINSTVVCEDFEGLIRYFARFNSHDRFNPKKKYNTAFGDIALNPNDTKPSFNYKEVVVEYIPREIMVIDEDDRIIDVRMYKDEILNYNGRLYSYRKRLTVNCVFRKDPVPDIMSKKRHRGTYYKLQHIIGELRQNCDTEIEKYTRKSRNKKKLIECWWDGIPRNYKDNKCWKNQKIKKQYMKHLDKHIDTEK